MIRLTTPTHRFDIQEVPLRLYVYRSLLNENTEEL